MEKGSGKGLPNLNGDLFKPGLGLNTAPAFTALDLTILGKKVATFEPSVTVQKSRSDFGTILGDFLPDILALLNASF